MKTVKLLAVAAALVAVGVLLFATGYLRLHYPSNARYPVRGIDVSHHQGEIAWSDVAVEDVSFAYIKASEGKDHRDTRFARNWQSAGEAGIARGAYHFFTFCSPGADQARHFLDVLPDEPGRLPPAVDVEFTGNCTSWTSVEAIRRELAIFLADVERATGRRALLYVTTSSYDKIVAGHLHDHELWVRGILWRPRLAAGRSWRIWQFADRARLSGIDGFVDLNVFQGDLPEFRAWLGEEPPASEAEVGSP